MDQPVQNARIHYREIGSGHPVLILHGGYLDHRHMVDALEPVFDAHPGWRRIYVDIPGHGASPVTASVTTHDEVLAALIEFVDAILVGERFAVIGESRGGFLARGIVHERPNQVTGGLFIVPGRYAEPRPGSVPEHVTLIRDDVLRANLAPDEVGRFDRLVVQSVEIMEKVRSRKMPAAALADLAHQEKIEARYEFGFDIDSQDFRFTGPVLMLLGRQDAMSGYCDALEVLEQYPRGTYAILDRAGHALAWEQPVLFNVLVGEWLDRVAEREQAL